MMEAFSALAVVLTMSISTAAVGSETAVFAYDALGRIIASVADSGPTNKSTTMYRYDAASNCDYIGVAKEDASRKRENERPT